MAAANFLNWSTLGSVTNRAGLLTFTDSAPGVVRRFSRVRQRP
jgi:hypothetical protein